MFFYWNNSWRFKRIFVTEGCCCGSAVVWHPPAIIIWCWEGIVMDGSSWLDQFYENILSLWKLVSIYVTYHILTLWLLLSLHRHSNWGGSRKITTPDQEGDISPVIVSKTLSGPLSVCKLWLNIPVTWWPSTYKWRQMMWPFCRHPVNVDGGSAHLMFEFEGILVSIVMFDFLYMC